MYIIGHCTYITIILHNVHCTLYTIELYIIIYTLKLVVKGKIQYSINTKTTLIFLI